MRAGGLLEAALHPQPDVAPSWRFLPLVLVLVLAKVVSLTATVKVRSPTQLAQMERGMANLQHGIKRIEASYGPDHLHLVLAVGYVRSLLANASIARHLEKHHPEIGEEFGRICEATAMGPEATQGQVRTSLSA